MGKEMNGDQPSISQCHVGVSLAPRVGDAEGVEQVPFFAVMYSRAEDAQAILRAALGVPLLLTIYRDETGFRYVVEREASPDEVPTSESGLSNELWEYRPEEVTHKAFMEALSGAGRWLLVIGTEGARAQAVLDSRRFTLRYSEL
jgi:hypothetical protein